MLKFVAAALLVCSVSAPALAAQDTSSTTTPEKAETKQVRPMVDRDPNALDVAKTPATDLNLAKDEIPAVLVNAVSRPYDLAGLKKCAAIVGAVEELDALLGPDMDLPAQERDRISAGRVAKTVVNSFIPFRGLIREFSGANDHDRQVRAAVQAGVARRGFLKGVGESKNCAYPARPATPEVVTAYLEKVGAADRKEVATAD